MSSETYTTELLQRDDAPPSLDTAPQSMEEAFHLFLKLEVAHGDPTEDTIASYLSEVRLWLAWCAAQGLDPRTVRRVQVQVYREWMKGQGYSVTTRVRKLSILRRFYEAAVRHELIATNPVNGVHGGKDLTPNEEKLKALTGSALARLVENMPNATLPAQRDRAIVGLMAIHGLRRVEVWRLDHSDLHEDGDGAFLRVTGKGRKQRAVYLRSDTYNALVLYRDGKFRRGLSTEGAFFVIHGNNGTGQRLARRSLNNVVDKHLSASALKRVGVSCHALRHTHGTLAVEGGAKIEHLRDEMGHASTSTSSIYVRAVGRKKHNPANFIDVEI